MIVWLPEMSEDTWQNAGTAAQQTVTNIANRAKDAADQALDAKRVSGGETIDEFFARKAKCEHTGVPMEFCTCSATHEGQR